MASEFEVWEAKNQVHLKKLVVLLKHIRNIAREGKICLVYDGRTKSGLMEIFESQDGGLKLSELVKKKLWGGC